MSRCYALTKQGKPCRNYAEVYATDVGLDGVPEIYYGLTCKCHRGFFNTLHHNLPTLAHGLEFRPIQRNFILRLFQEEIVVIDADGLIGLGELFFRHLGWNNNYDHFLYLCAKHLKGFRFNWNTELCLSSLSACSWQSVSLGPVDIPHTYPLTFYKTMDDPKAGFFILLETCGASVGRFFTVVDMLLNSEPGRLALLDADFPSDTHLASFKNTCNRDDNLVHVRDLVESGEFKNYILFHKREIYDKCKRRLDQIRDDLLALAWQPRRVQAWCLSLEEAERVRKFELNMG